MVRFALKIPLHRTPQKARGGERCGLQILCQATPNLSIGPTHDLKIKTSKDVETKDSPRLRAHECHTSRNNQTSSACSWGPRLFFVSVIRRNPIKANNEREAMTPPNMRKNHLETRTRHWRAGTPSARGPHHRTVSYRSTDGTVQLTAGLPSLVACTARLLLSWTLWTPSPCKPTCQTTKR